MTKDLTPFFQGFAPDAAAQDDARIFSALYSHKERLWGRLEDLLMCFTSFCRDYDAAPSLPEGLAEGVGVLSYAASGLLALMEDGQADTWGTLTLARMWAVDKCHRSTADLPLDEVDALHLAYSNPHLLPAWAYDLRAAGRLREGGWLAGWWAVSHLLEAAPYLEDGEADGQVSAVLDALAHPMPAPTPRPHLMLSSSPEELARALIEEGTQGIREIEAQRPAGLSEVVLTVQSVQALPAGRVRLEVQGGEGYEVGRSECSYTPLPDGGAFLSVFVGTIKAEALRLEAPEAAQVRELLGFGEDPSTTDPRLN